jgi:hypothetical protein
MKKLLVIAIVFLACTAMAQDKKVAFDNQEEPFVFMGEVYPSQQYFVEHGKCAQPVLEEYVKEQIELEVQEWRDAVGFPVYTDAKGGNGNGNGGGGNGGGGDDCSTFDPPAISIPIAYHVITDGSNGNVSSAPEPADQRAEQRFQRHRFFLLRRQHRLHRQRFLVHHGR